MDWDKDIAEARPAVLLASALHLLSCSAMHGVSCAKSRALIQHLSALADRPDTDPLLARACDELADVWHRVAGEVEQQRVADAEARRVMTERDAQAVLH